MRDSKRSPDLGEISEELMRRAKQLENVVENSPGVIYQFQIDAKGAQSFTYVSKQAFEVYELTPEEFAASPTILIDMCHPDDRENLNRGIEQAIQSKAKFYWKGRIVSKTGKLKWVDARSIFNSQSNEVLVWDGIIMDITQQVEMENQLNLQRAISLQNSKLTAMGQMSAGIAHEINNPLAVIGTSARIIMDTNSDNENTVKKCEMIQKCVTRISKVVRSLKKFSRREGETQFAKVNFIKTLDEVLSFIKLSSISKNIEIQLEHNLDENFHFDCDEIEIEQVLFNLISNAVDACRESTNPLVKIEVQKNEKFLAIKITDTGPGFSNEIKQNMFSPFHTTKQAGKGTGLGLSICKDIVDSHKGEIYLDEGSSQTCMALKLPLKQD